MVVKYSIIPSNRVYFLGVGRFGSFHQTHPSWDCPENCLFEQNNILSIKWRDERDDPIKTHCTRCKQTWISRLKTSKTTAFFLSLTRSSGSFSNRDISHQRWCCSYERDYIIHVWCWCTSTCIFWECFTRKFTRQSGFCRYHRTSVMLVLHTYMTKIKISFCSQLNKYWAWESSNLYRSMSSVSCLQIPNNVLYTNQTCHFRICHRISSVSKIDWLINFLVHAALGRFSTRLFAHAIWNQYFRYEYIPRMPSR